MKCKILSINHKPSDWEGKALDFSALLKKKLNMEQIFRASSIIKNHPYYR